VRYDGIIETGISPEESQTGTTIRVFLAYKREGLIWPFSLVLGRAPPLGHDSGSTAGTEKADGRFQI
jgi:hypothetical protein